MSTSLMRCVRGGVQVIQESTGHMLAQVHRSQSALSYMTGLDTYALRVFPGVDLALMVVLVNVIEEVFVEETNRQF